MSPAPKKMSSIHLGVEAVSLWLYFSVQGGGTRHTGGLATPACTDCLGIIPSVAS